MLGLIYLIFRKFSKSPSTQLYVGQMSFGQLNFNFSFWDLNFKKALSNSFLTLKLRETV